MRAKLHSRLVAAVVAPAIFAAAAAQGLQFMRCGEQVRMSCCCHKEAPGAPASQLTTAPVQCCGELAVPTTPARTHETSWVTAPAPVLVAVLAPAPPESLEVARVRDAPRLDPPPRPSPILANCTLLI